jgi:hypothetical protein
VRRAWSEGVTHMRCAVRGLASRGQRERCSPTVTMAMAMGMMMMCGSGCSGEGWCVCKLCVCEGGVVQRCEA